MNILFDAFNEDWHGRLISRLSDKCNADYVVSLSLVNHRLESERWKYIWLNNIYFAQHEYEKMDKHITPFLDEDMLVELSWCERIYMKMLDRSEIVLSKRISYEERKSFYYHDLQELLYILTYYKIDVCIFSITPHISFDFALYGLCKYLGLGICIEYLGMLIPGKSVTAFFMNDYRNPFPELRGKDYSLYENKVELSSRVQSYIDYYDKDKNNIAPLIYFQDFYFDKEEINYYKIVLDRIKEGKITATIKRKIKRAVEGVIQSVFFITNCKRLDLTKEYIYFPLHFQPECTSVPMGGSFSDQVLVINQISALLPKDKWLYIKPHPNRSYVDMMPLYKHIVSLPNVKLINPNENTYELIDNCKAVASLTGTVICEGLVRGKPALMFGYYIWQYAPGVFVCRKWNDCRDAIKKIFDNEIVVRRSEFTAFLRDVDKYLYNGGMNRSVLKLFQISDEENISNMVEGYYENLKSQGLLAKY